MTSARRNDVVMVAVGVLLIVLDQLVKHWITGYFTTGGRIDSAVPIVGNILELIYVKNTGVAFSFLQGQAILYVLIAIAVAVIGWLYWRNRNTGSLLLKVTFGLIIGGALGNLIDRLRLGYVVDFIHFQIPAINFNFAVFNVADSGISIGVILLIFLLMFGNTTKQPQPASEQTTSLASVSSNPATTANAVNAAGDNATAEPRIRRRVANGR